ncbi:hypothetical protein OEZ85_007146 [Tetradesmus obliquus]|uniref:AAA+ ATPase domain-containing protein n=1 Tax=Tetradesmus obliquus TaxID=3088 RepID=A0ABY8TXH6_TETOB|nr:hypothetical protein OEZ85_007146 [Tetradesmus obliquus]
MPEPKEPGEQQQRGQSPEPGCLRQQLYPQARQSIVLPQPKLVAEVKRQGSLSPVLGGRLSTAAGKHLPPLEAAGALGKLADGRPSLIGGTKEMRLPETLEAPKQQLNPLHKQGLIAAPALRGSFAQHKQHLSIDVLQAGNSTARSGLLSPAMAAAAAAGRPGSPGPRSSLVLPSSPMAPPHASGMQLFADPAAAGGARSRSPVAQQQGMGSPGATGMQQQQAAAGVATPTAAAPSKPGTAAGKQPEQDEYNYIKLIYTLREYPTTEDFVYLRRFKRYPADCNPYALEVVQFGSVDQADYYTLSVRGITRYVDGVNAEFATLDQWEREVQLYIALKQLALFRQHKLWKAFKSWKHSIDSSKIAAAKASLNKQLFMLSPVFQGPLQRFHQLCHELSSMRVHNLKPAQVYTLKQFAESHAEHSEVCAERLEEFSEQVYETVEQACRDALIQLQQQLETLAIKSEGEAGTAAGMSLSGGSGKQGHSMPGGRGSMVSASGGLTSPNGISAAGGKADDGKPQQQAQMVSVLLEFNSCVTSIRRLYSRPELVSGVLGAKAGDLQEATPLAELVIAGDLEELVNATKAAMDVALARANMQKNAYEQFKDMMLFDRQLDLASLSPAFKAACGFKGLAAAAAAGEFAPATAEASLVGLGQQPSSILSPMTPSPASAAVAAAAAAVSDGPEHAPVSLHTFRSLLDKLMQQKCDIEGLLPAADVDIVRINAAALKQALIPWPVNRLAELHKALPVLAADLLHEFMDHMHSAQPRLSAVCSCVEEYVEKLTFLAELTQLNKVMDAACAQVHAVYALLDEYKIKVPDVDRAGYASLDSTYAGLKALMEEVEAGKEEAVAKYSAGLESGVEGLAKEIEALRIAAQNEMLLNEESSPAAVLDELQQLRAQLAGHAQELARINQFQRLFKVAESTVEDLAAVQDDVALKLSLWTSSAEFEDVVAGWRGCHFEALDLATMEETMARFHKSVFKMEKGLPPNKLVPKLRAAVDEYRLLLPVVSALRNKTLKERHWAKVFAAIGTTLARDETFTLQALLDAKVGAAKDACMAISTEATQEAALEELLAKVTAKWAGIEFCVIPYKDSKDMYILGALDEIQVALEDSLMTMSTILASRFVAGIRPEVERVEKQLNVFSDTLDQWVQVQKSWMYLEPIFSAQDIQKQLPSEYRAFDHVHKQLREVMRRTKDRPNALQTASNPSLLESLSKSYETLEAIQKSLEEYLETKRVAFPRFYFLSNDELLEILAQTKNVQAVQPHMGKCFDGIRRLDFGDDPKSTDIFAMVSGEGERVSFGKNPLKARNSVEQWLGTVESGMVASLRRLAKQGMASYPEEPRSDWVLRQPVQLVLAVSQVYWCAAVEEQLRSAAPHDGLTAFYQLNVRQLAELTRLVRGDLSNLGRRLLAALITIDVHSRDIVGSLLAKATSSVNDFEWQMQLRYYFEEEDLVVRQVIARFLYAYEYLGAQPRLVVTPMTDRCYLTLTGALHLKLGGAPAGPAGTGKTETTKDLGKALGVNCVVFNCGENLDYKFMGKFFSGLAQCGAWACFDEFNRIDVEVLSVVAQQLLTIQHALKANLNKFWFEGRPIKLVPTCGVFITMNPGYAGRTELPDNLKALFRPCSMMIPDYALVAEVMLFSEGFEDSKALSRKMVKLYKLASEQLSQQDHYDFGMRAVKSVLVMAGGLKRANPELPEDVVLIRAMRDSNLPKFLTHDMELFCNIIADLFPGLDVPNQDYGELEQSIRAVLSQRGLQQPANFVTKVVQMYDTMCVRFGLMLVGPTGGGKTTCCGTLQGALTHLRKEMNHPNEQLQVIHTYRLNPKCIKMGELYGEYNLLTNEWTDGLASTIIRGAVADTSLDRKWVVFDGPVDAVWIENMNTVLDDNCTLCLPNGERIKLNPTTMRMVFEVSDLSAASPATVSRCGMVFIAQDQLGWRPAVQTWLETALPQAVPGISAAQREHIYGLFDKYVDGGLAWVRKQGKEYIPSVDNNLTSTLMLLLQSLMDPTKGLKVAALEGDALAAAMGRLFGFAYVWALGGNLAPSCTESFDEFVREHLADVVTFPGGGLVFDHQLHFKSGVPEFKPWADTVPSFTYSKAVPYFQMLVPTVDTVRFSYLLEACLDVQRSVLFTGVTGVGKSVISAAALEKLAAAPQPAGVADSGCSGRVAGRLLAHTVVFSAQTSSIDTQLLIESKLEKKRKTRYGAPVNKKIVFFIDDVNMPAREKYGAQPPIELLRQFQDFRGFYDRKKLFWKDVEDTVLCAACAPPGGGRQEVTARFFRHFTMLSIPPPSDAAIKTILSSILTGFLADFAPDLRSMAGPLVNASTAAYNRISEELLPTPAKSHYTFNLRDLSKQFQGMLLVSPGCCSDKEALARLWMHEACRVFADRLVCDEDRQYFQKMLIELSAKHGLSSMSYEEAFEKRSIAWGDFLRPGLERGERQYEEVSDNAKLLRLLEDYLDEYNMIHTNTLNLVFFQHAVDHICRLARVLRQPRGNAMLVGAGGSGKRSLTCFAAHISGFKTFQIELSRGYGATEFREDLKKLYRTAGVDGEPVVFLFSDTQIVQEGFLEDINNMLNSGEVPGLFAPDEKEQIINDVREWVEATGGNPSKDGCYNAFINRVRDNLHIVLTMSPVGEAFRARCRQFSSLINCCTIDWFSTWPAEALLSVSQKFLANTDLGSPQVNAAVAQMCVHIHTSVEQMSERFYAELRRRYYTTPKSYLDLINLYLQLLQEKRDELGQARNRLLDGLKKLNETNALVASMKADLARLQPELESKAAATADLLVKVSADQEEAEKVKVGVAAEEKDVKAMQQQTQAIADAAQAELAEAMPALQAAIDSLKALNKNDIVEIKSFPKPPPLVQMTMEAVCILKQEKPDWDTAKRVLGDVNFMRSLEDFDKDNIPDAVIKKLRRYIDDPNYQPDVVAKQSRAAMSLCMWTRAMDVYNRVAKVVEPKRQKLREAEAQLEQANAQLQEKQDALAAVVSRVNSLKKQLADAQSEQCKLNDQVDLTRKRLERAGKLTSGLADEGVRWQATADQLQTQTELLVGDVFLSAACIAYYGAFTGSYREELVSSWVAKCQELAIPVSQNCTLRGTLASPVEVREWLLAGLPSDGTSIDSSILVTRGKRWPLMIDPQGQANAWVKNMESRSGLRVIKLTDSNFLRTLENCIRIGNPCLIEDVGEVLDPALEPVLQRCVFKQGGRLLIRLGDADVDYDPAFKLYITTKLANPHYLPEVCIKVTLINFTVTMQGLEDQLLGEVVRQERPELEDQRDRLVTSIAADKRQLQDLEDKILKLLRECEGNILDDEQLLATLNNSKLTSAAIQNRVKEAEETERNINAARESYRPAATRGSILYFAIADLAGISPMYQFSLAYFIRLFSHCIEASGKSGDVAVRLQLLSEYATSFVFKNVSRGLFEEHKLLFSFLLCTSILRHPSANDIADVEWACLVRGAATAAATSGSGSSASSSHKPRAKPDAAYWLPDEAWQGLLLLEQLVPPLKGLGDSIQQDTRGWKEWYESAEPHQQPLPGPWQEQLGGRFAALLLVKQLREEKLMFAAQQYVAAKLGREFTEPEPWTLDGVFEETSARTPIIFILSTGADPTAMLQRFGERRGWVMGQRLHLVSLGQGQGLLAETMIKQAATAGDWVCLQNCHLAASWMRHLQEQVEELAHGTSQNVHPDFRLWLTSMPSPVFPVPVLQNGIKLTNEPPKGVKANIGRTYNDAGDELLDSCAAKPSEWRRLLFSLSFFHAVVQERRKFGPLGWNICYEFNASDLECSSSTLRMFLDEAEAIPWEALEYVIGQVNYGGRVTDDLDRRCLTSVLRQFLSPRIVRDECAALTHSGTYCVPRDGSMESYREYIKALPSTEAPEVFGMHANANIAFQLQETRRLLDAVLSIQPRISGGSGSSASSSDAVVAALCAETLEALPADLDLSEAAAGLFERMPDGKLNSLSVVLGQEVERFQRLAAVLRQSLVALQAAIRGQVVMSAELEAAYNALLLNQVPELWQRVAYPSLKPLAGWVRDYDARVAFMRSWLANGPPACFWLPGFFFPQGFMTGVLQMHARKYSIPIDSLSFGFEVTQSQSGSAVAEPPADGIFVDGLWIDGGRWDSTAGCLQESQPGVMRAPLPVVHFKPVQSYEPPAEQYQCPLYKTSERAGVLSTTGQSTNFVLCVSLPVARGTGTDFWVLQGVALLCQLDT